MCGKYNINQGIDGFILFPALNIVPKLVIFQLVACLRTKFGNVEAVDTLQV